MDELNNIMTSLAAIAIPVWVATETLTPAVAWLVSAIFKKDVALPKDLVAVVLGAGGGVAAWSYGWLQIGGTGFGGAAGAAFLGLLATMAAGAGHDKVVKPVVRTVWKPKTDEPTTPVG